MDPPLKWKKNPEFFETSLVRKFNQLSTYVLLIPISQPKNYLSHLLAMANLEDNVGKVTLVATGDGRIIVGKSLRLSLFRLVSLFGKSLRLKTVLKEK